ncbi:hypothetical protein [Brevundimonas sp. SL161]|uniref:hypothetical protein n=1 Tax=Brevundimonas sp. SL161 TaxID=2804613 RepID=UPI003CF69BAF
MTKTPTAAERRTARLAAIAAGKTDTSEQARKRADAAALNADPAIADAGMNQLVLIDALAEMDGLAQSAARMKAHADDLIPSSPETELWISQVATLMQVQANLIAIAGQLMTQTSAAIAAVEPAA